MIDVIGRNISVDLTLDRPLCDHKLKHLPLRMNNGK